MANEDAQQEMLKKKALSSILSRNALERLSRIKIVKPEVAAQLENYLINLYQQGKIRTEISEEQMIAILEAVSQKKEFNLVK